MELKIFLYRNKISRKISLVLPVLFSVFLVFILNSCGPAFIKPTVHSFIENNYVNDREYILLKTLEPGSAFSLARGKRVKVVIRFSDEWIKVYAYNSKEERLRARIVLAIFITEQESENKILNLEKFKSAFNELFKPVK